MSDADKMFEELGYTKKEWDSTTISYSLEIDDDGYIIKTILFEKERKNIDIYHACLTMQELKAIYKKCEELG